ncbi:CubicO group peptidase (beta-lactamase class C family) [Microbacterium sp. AG1240]|uniref:serine hydrolase domain-containing protein n=1 Tax=Microbacterium sp. AG1240 TaxID=2183992 RepID=UPI000EB01FA4|nr:serine hydrolase domain-containing protein [Microbacterium sp. AG1240]RKT33535.1 CubicO group peptidase (beta-lactamase class C family) [Microbacterium sp. AG1240]
MANPTMDAARLDELERVIRADIDGGRYFGAALKVSRHGRTVLDIAVGHADPERTHPITTDSVFSVFSITKAFVNVLVLRAVELGRFALTTRMSEIVPEFTGQPRERASIFHFLTHTTGMPGVWEPVPGLLLEELHEAVEAVIGHVHGSVEPGSRCDYAPMANHVLLAEALRRTDPRGRSIGQILREDLWDPLGMTDTNLGILPHMRDRHVVPQMRGVLPITSKSRTSPGDYGLYTAERNEAVWAGSASTTGDLQRFMEMLRRGGALEGVRILSPQTVAAARRVWTADLPNELYRTVALRNGDAVPPANLGLGFNVRGDGMFVTQLGTLTSPETFGNYGAGTGLVWVDPATDLSFVGLSAGLLTQADNIARYQRISDMVVAAAI